MLTRSERMDLAQDIFDRLTEGGSLGPDTSEIRAMIETTREQAAFDLETAITAALVPLNEKLDAILRLLLAHTTAAHKQFDTKKDARSEGVTAR